jgi:putative flippase GtrA
MTQGHRTVVRFLVTGAANTAIGLSVIIAARELLGFNEYASNVTGYAVGIVIGFLLNRSWTFTHSGNYATSAPRYLLAFAIAYGINLGVLFLGLEHSELPRNAIQLAALISYSATFYVLCKRFVFRS